MGKVNKKQMYYLLVSTILHQSQSSKITIKNSIAFINELEKENYYFTKKKLISMFQNGVIKHRFPNKMIDYLENMFFTLEVNFNGDIKNVFDENNEIQDNLKKFKGIGEHKSKVCMLKYMFILQNDFDFDEYCKVVTNCYSLDKYFIQEIKIIQELEEK